MQRRQKLQQVRELARGREFINEVLAMLNPAEMEMLKSAIYERYGARPMHIINLGEGTKPTT